MRWWKKDQENKTRERPSSGGIGYQPHQPPNEEDTHVIELLWKESTGMGNPQRAAAVIAANFANGSVPRETSRASTLDELGVETRRRRGRSEASRALAEQLLEDLQ